MASAFAYVNATVGGSIQLSFYGSRQEVYFFPRERQFLLHHLCPLSLTRFQRPVAFILSFLFFLVAQFGQHRIVLKRRGVADGLRPRGDVAQ
jgi:hypothetical protein